MTSVRRDLAMLCDYVICRHGTTQPGTVTVTLERGATVIVIKDVPAEVEILRYAA